MRTIAIINQKGGCGKTTTSINLAAVLALKGHRTLLVDMDPQSHCALGLAVPESQIERSTADLLRHGLDGSISVADITWQISRGLDLAPSSLALAGIEQVLATAPDKDRRLAQVLSPVQDKYDFCIIDCPPSIGLLTFNALRTADEVLIPVETGFFAMQGSIRQEKTIEMLVRRVGHRVRFRVLPTMYDVRTKLAREILSELKKHFGERVLPIVINFNSKLKEAASFGQPITEYDAASRGMQDFEDLAHWLLQHPPQAATPIAQETVAATQSETASLKPRAEEQSDEAPDRSDLLDIPDRDAVTRLAPDPQRDADLQPIAQPARTTHPAMSRAAELVERARALSARTADLNARFRDPVTATPKAEPAGPPQPPSIPKHDPATPASLIEQAKQLDPLAHLTQTKPTPEPANTPTLVQTPSPADPQRAALKQKIDKLYGVRTTPRGVLFIQPDEPGQNLAIAGDFNNWNPSQTPMTRDENLGVCQACIKAPPGRYRYRLVKDGQWVQDPFNKTVESNPFGELNNIIEIK